MSAAETVTITCPHCTKTLRALSAHAGKQVRCPNQACLKPVPVPFTLDDEDEPEEPVLLPEDPANPVSVPVASPPRAETAPKPRRKARRYEEDDEDEPQPRAATWPWALAAVAGLLLLSAGTGLGWMLLRTDDKSTGDSGTTFAALEKNRESKSDKSKSKGPGGTRPGGAAAKPDIQPEPPPPEPLPPNRPDPLNDPPPRPPARPVPAPEFKWPEPPPRPPIDPRPPVIADPGAAAFVGKWEMVLPQFQEAKIDLEATIEFRADGTCLTQIVRPINDSKTGKWRWDGKKLHMEVAGEAKQKPADIKWNNPDEFVVTIEDQPVSVTMRRKGKAPRP